MKRTLILVLCFVLALGMLTMASAENVVIEAVPNEGQFEGEELTILVSAGWMDHRYDDTIARFEETYGVTVDLQSLPADQYFDKMTSALDTGTCADVFWTQSNPAGMLVSMIGDPEGRCIDFTGAEWQNVMPEARQAACIRGRQALRPAAVAQQPRIRHGLQQDSVRGAGHYGSAHHLRGA